MEQPNLNYIKDMSGGDADFEAKIIGILKAEFPEEKATYFDKVAQNDYKQIAEIVHKLKHKISILGLESSYKDAVEFEHNLFDGNTEGKDKFEDILQRMTAFLEIL